MKEIKLEKRYPDSRDEDITDAFARGYSDGYSAGVVVGRKAVQTVIRSRTFMRAEDFKEWAKRVKEENQNVIVIPCDAEVAAPKRGEWKTVEDFDGDLHYQCTQCGEEWTFPYGTPEENNANFCPCCGARIGGDAV